MKMVLRVDLDMGQTRLLLILTTIFLSMLLSEHYVFSETIRVPGDYPTIQEAVDNSYGDDTILVAPGVYNEHINGDSRLIISENGPLVTRINGTVFSQSRLKLNGFTIHGYRLGLGGVIELIPFDSWSVVQNCIVSVAEEEIPEGEYFRCIGMFAETGMVFIYNNILFNSRKCTYGSAIYVDVHSGADIHHNIIYNCHAEWYGPAIRLDEVVTNDGVSNNVLYHNTSSSGGIIDLSTSHGNSIRNNIFINNDAMGGGAMVLERWDNSMIEYNLFWENEGADSQNCTVGEGNLHLDPMFVDLFGLDFHLDECSPGIDSGRPGDNYSLEPEPNGDRINMGNYGNTGEATSWGGDACNTPTPTETPTVTPTGIPTITPTNTPSETPTATPECTALGVTLWMPSDYFTPGDPCACKVFACNPGSGSYSDVPLFVILDVYGQYFFAPSFGEFDHYSVDLAPGLQETEILPEFQWPEGAGSASDIIWYAAMTDAAITQLFGEMDAWAFGWGG